MRIQTQSLNFRSLGVWFLVGILWLNFPPDDEFSHIILLCQIEEFANLAGSFRSKTFRMSSIGKSRKISIALFDDNNRKNRKIRTDDTTTNRFSFTFTSTTGTVARMTFGEEEADTGRMKNTLIILEK